MRTVLALSTCLFLAAPALGDTTGDKLHDIEHFFQDARIVSGPTLVENKLSRGTEMTCFSIIVIAEPKTYIPWPWCPGSITDTTDKDGIWPDDRQDFDIVRTFVGALSRLSDNRDCQLFDPSIGKVRVTDTQAACQATARPDVDPEYNNYCVQFLPEYMTQAATMT